VIDVKAVASNESRDVYWTDLAIARTFHMQLSNHHEYERFRETITALQDTKQQQGNLVSVFSGGDEGNWVPLGGGIICYTERCVQVKSWNEAKVFINVPTTG
jgi:hypothetical protein